jgi:putative transposase
VITSLTVELVDAIRATPVPRKEAFTPDRWAAVEKRLAALEEVLSGAPLALAAERSGVDTKTITRMLKVALERDERGRLHGYQACIPHKRFAPPTPSGATVPRRSHAFAFQLFLKAMPKVERLLHQFKGSLPTRNSRSPSFDRLFRSIHSIIRSEGYADHYPANVSDKGRRATLEYLRRYRRMCAAQVASEQPEEPSISRVEHLLTVQPFDRFEYDEHFVDIDAWMALPLADGTFRLERVRQIWLLAMVDVGSWAPVAASLVIGRKFNSEDVCDLFARSLSPWEPRKPVVEAMRYSERAWMPGCLVDDGTVPRSVMVALDNDATHLSRMTRENLVNERLGIINFGRAGVPESRPYIEALFKRTEDALLRYIAGGFRPETAANARTAVSTLRGSQYPIFADALEDIVDIYFSAANASDRNARDTRSPRSVMEDYINSGALLWRCPDTNEHIRRLMVRRMRVRVTGSRGAPPRVYQDYASYRSPQLTSQRGLIGRSFVATYENPLDIRQLTLWGDDGARIMTLHALPPYAAAPHTLATRKRAEAWARSNGRRPGRPSEAENATYDNVMAYHAAVRSAAASKPWAAALVAGGQVPPRPPVMPSSLQAPLAGLRPLPRPQGDD